MHYYFIINSLIGGGTEKVCCQISSRLSQDKNDVTIFVLDDEGSSYEVSDKVKIVYLGKTSTLKSFWKLKKVLKDINGHSVLIFNHELSLVALLIKKLFKYNVKIISRINNTLSVTIKHKSKKYQYVVSPLMKAFYRYIDGYIFQSTGIQKDMNDNYSVNERYVVINNPIERFKIDVDKEVKKENYILYVGRLVKQKNVKDTIKAFSLFLNTFPDYKLVIVGDGPEKESLMQLSRKLGIESNVSFVGHKKNTKPYYENAKLTVLSSFNEGFPNVLLESILYRTPIVSYDCPSGPRDIINDHNGILVEYLSVEKLAEAMSFCINKSWNYNGIYHTTEKYSLEKITSQYEKFIKSI
ncbi:glycosyltransferase [Vibrio diabolicus]|uniref:glycosyltransferase n=1 Tax=Vibrio diabolicus TaxID=50719 RepID=UPI003D7D4B65